MNIKKTVLGITLIMSTAPLMCSEAGPAAPQGPKDAFTFYKMAMPSVMAIAEGMDQIIGPNRRVLTPDEQYQYPRGTTAARLEWNKILDNAIVLYKLYFSVYEGGIKHDYLALLHAIAQANGYFLPNNFTKDSPEFTIYRKEGTPVPVFESNWFGTPGSFYRYKSDIVQALKDIASYLIKDSYLGLGEQGQQLKKITESLK